jgi:integrase/recombinase XerD
MDRRWELKLLRKSDFDKYPEDLKTRAMWAILKACGCRTGELISLRVSDLDLEKRTVRIVDSKKKVPFLLPLSVECCDVLRDYLETLNGSEWLFPSRSFGGQNHICKENCRWRFKAYGLQPRDFRRYFSRNWVLKGGSLTTLKSILRHSRIEMSLHYAEGIKFVEEAELEKAEYDKLMN